MPTDTSLLPLCVGLSVLGVIATGFAWRRGNKGRVIQGAGVALAPVALYFSGLLRLVWNGVAAIIDWATRLVFSPVVWFGFSLLVLCILLWIGGGFLARRLGPARRQQSAKTAPAGAGRAGVTTGPGTGGNRAGKPVGAEVDPELDEIEALLKSRGIE